MAQELGCLQTALRAAALLSAGSSFWWTGNTPETKAACRKAAAQLATQLGCEGEGDVVLGVRIMERWESLGDEGAPVADVADETAIEDALLVINDDIVAPEEERALEGVSLNPDPSPGPHPIGDSARVRCGRRRARRE